VNAGNTERHRIGWLRAAVLGANDGNFVNIESVLHCLSALTKGVSLRRSVPKQFVAHVRPELFCHIEERIQGYLLSPLVCRIPNDRSAAG